MDEEIKFSSDNVLYVKCYDRWFKVAALFTDEKSANCYLLAKVETENPKGVIKVIGEFIFVADISDEGIKEVK